LAGQNGIAGFPNTAFHGMIHTHPDGTLPIFSPTDIYTGYNALQEGKISSLAAFTEGLVTSNGIYFLAVSDSAKYINFCTNNPFEEAGYYILDLRYGLPSFYNITTTTSATIAVNSFTRLLHDYDCGLALMVRNTDSNSYRKMKISNNIPAYDNCP
jgi:hypothetical protein